ncbi:Uncharacterised protein [Macrococcoides caseolyticum]|nr:hypothetical protein [Macrococcus caseolyticus]STY75038.1 Uncharacterised protein [Macrococcus caseolyticus]
MENIIYKNIFDDLENKRDFKSFTRQEYTFYNNDKFLDIPLHG